ncbi:ABC transporter permease, partial [Candidatus Falkowbacteria bacterium]|nr:ABC transporter permease [Candidatus Falkowbacteria bacterium]
MINFIKQCACTSTTSILANKGRSFLTMLGIIIGVAAVIIITALGAGAQNLIISQIETFGTNKVGVLPGKSDDQGAPASAYGIVVTSLKLEDAEAIKEQIPHIEAVVAFANDAASVSWQSNSYSTNIKGVSADYFLVEGGKIEQGRPFTDREIKDLSKVAILGYTVKKEIFGESDPIGEKVKIKGHIFEVIGTTEERGTVAFQNYDDQVLVPIKTVQKILAGVDHINLIRASVDDEKNIPEVEERMTMLLRDRHDISDQSGDSDDFSVRSSADALSIITTITDALKYFLAAMAALSLIVGGIGIMNIM